MKFVSILISILFISSLGMAKHTLDCNFRNNRYFDLDASTIRINKSFDSYYHESLFLISVDTSKNDVPLRKQFSCKILVKTKMKCLFINGKTKTIEIQSLSYRNNYLYGYDEFGGIIKDLRQSIYINDRPLENLLSRYRDADCIIKL